jgi:hypothetical protein
MAQQRTRLSTTPVERDVPLVASIVVLVAAAGAVSGWGLAEAALLPGEAAGSSAGLSSGGLAAAAYRAASTLTGDAVGGPRLLSVTCAIIAAVGAMRLGALGAGRWAAPAVGWSLLVVSPALQLVVGDPGWLTRPDRYAFSVAPAAAATLWALWLCRSWLADDLRRTGVLSGLLLGVAATVEPVALAVVPAMVVCLRERPGGARRLVRDIGLLLGVAAVTATLLGLVASSAPVTLAAPPLPPAWSSPRIAPPSLLGLALVATALVSARLGGGDRALRRLLATATVTLSLCAVALGQHRAVALELLVFVTVPACALGLGATIGPQLRRSVDPRSVAGRVRAGSCAVLVVVLAVAVIDVLRGAG